jgi:hypothetical protein
MNGINSEEINISFLKEIAHIKNNNKVRDQEYKNLNDRVYKQEARLTVVENNVSNNNKQLEKIQESVDRISLQLIDVDKSLNDKKMFWRAMYIIISIGIGLGAHEKLFNFLGLH